MMEKEIADCMMNLIEAIRNSSSYKEYTKCEAELARFPGMPEQIMDLRKQTIELYDSGDEETVKSGTECLGLKYEEIQRIPEVNAFLEAEENLVRILQDISTGVSGSMNLLTPDL